MACNHNARLRELEDRKPLEAGDGDAPFPRLGEGWRAGCPLGDEPG